jgi:hypothetical protein
MIAIVCVSMVWAALYLGVSRNDAAMRRLRVLGATVHAINANLDDEASDEALDAALTTWENALNRERIMLPIRFGVALLMLVASFALAIVYG